MSVPSVGHAPGAAMTWQSEGAEPVGALLCGGYSRRMGCDKARVSFAGVTLLERALSLVAGAVGDVFVLSRADLSLPPSRVPYTRVDDRVPGSGPAAAIADLIAREGRPALVVAVDMPLLDAAAIAWLLGRYAARGPGMAVVDGRMTPTFAVYPAPVPACGPNRRLTSWARECQLEGWPAPRSVADVLCNVNTPSELESARRVARRERG